MADRVRAVGRVLYSSARTEALDLATNPSAFVVVAIQPAAFTLLALLGARGPAPPDPARVLLGVGLLSTWGATMWTAGLLMRKELWQGSLVTLAHQPADLRLVILGKCAGAVAVSAALIVLSVSLTALSLGITIVIADPLRYAAAVAASLVSVTVLGFAFSCVFVMSRAAVRVVEALVYPVFILGGLLIPLDLLPPAAHVVAHGLSLYWGGVLATAAMTGSAAGGVAWAMLAGATATYGAVGLVAFGLVMRRAREAGTLDFH